jgi:hypothetical protein
MDPILALLGAAAAFALGALLSARPLRLGARGREGPAELELLHQELAALRAGLEAEAEARIAGLERLGPSLRSLRVEVDRLALETQAHRLADVREGARLAAVEARLEAIEGAFGALAGAVRPRAEASGPEREAG